MPCDRGLQADLLLLRLDGMLLPMLPLRQDSSSKQGPNSFQLQLFQRLGKWSPSTARLFNILTFVLLVLRLVLSGLPRRLAMHPPNHQARRYARPIWHQRRRIRRLPRSILLPSLWPDPRREGIAATHTRRDWISEASGYELPLGRAGIDPLLFLHH